MQATIAAIRKWATNPTDEVFLVVTVNGINIPLQQYQINEQETDEALIQMLLDRSKR